MTLNSILQNSQYITDEEIATGNLVGMANNAIAELNSKVRTNLPLFTISNLNTEYWALGGTWLLRLIEPYISFSIMSNDGDNTKNDHYTRFLDAINDFKKNGLADIALVYPEGYPLEGQSTGYEGKSSKKALMDVSERTIYWGY